MQLPPQQNGMPGMPRPPIAGPASQQGGFTPAQHGAAPPPLPGQFGMPPNPMGDAPRPPTQQMQGLSMGGPPGGARPGMGAAPQPPPSIGGPLHPMMPFAPPSGAAPPLPGMGGTHFRPPGGPPGMPGPPHPGGMGMPPPPHGPPSMGMQPPPGPSGMARGPPPGPSIGQPGHGHGMMPPPGPPMGQMGPGHGHGLGTMQRPGPPQPPPFSSSFPHPPGGSMGGAPPGPQGVSSPGNRIDPSQIPRPSNSPPSAPMEFETRVLGGHAVPPPASSRFHVRDRGNAGPRYMRSTLNQIPFTNDMQNNSGMPLALAVSPLSLPHPNDDLVPVVDLGELGPVRCGRCRAYISPFMRFSSSGRNFTCNFCGHSNATPEAYFCHMGHDGRRRDADERAELCCGSVEFVATAEYQVRPPMQQHHFFLVEVTTTAISTGVTASVCAAISRVLEDMPDQEKVNVGIATFDGTIHFYSLRGGATQAQMLVVPDVSEVFVPDSVPLVVNLAEQREALLSLLEQIPSMFSSSIGPSSCGGAAIEASIAALERTGGKVHAFLAMLPTVGSHALVMRDTTSGLDKEKLTFLQSQDNTLKTLAMTAADLQVCIDICFMAQGYCDLATFRDLSLTTGGTMYQYTPFSPMMDHDQVLNDLKWNVTRPQGLEAVMRVRCSQGLEVSSYMGAFNRMAHNPTDVQLPAIDCDKSIIVSVKHLEKLAPGAEAYFQAALLYTTAEGQRRIRVHTLGIPITDNMTTVFKAADLDAQIAAIGRRVAATLPSSSLQSARDSINNQAVTILAAYRRYCASSSSSGQLILPETLRLLPLYALSLLKGPALKEGVKPDECSMWISQMMSLEACRITPLLYPRLLLIADILQSGAEPPEDLPEGLTLSSEKLVQGGVYLLENGFEALLHVDRHASPQLFQELLGVSSRDELLHLPTAVALLPRDNRLSQCLQQLLVKVRIHRSSFLRLRVTRKGDPNEVAFFNMLMEDRSSSGSSYVEYLCQLHRLIQAKL